MGGGLAWINHTVVIKVLNGSPICKLYTYKTNSRGNINDSLSEISIRSVVVDGRFIDSLMDKGILTLPNGPAGGYDGIQFCVQVATHNSYRFYSYWSPDPKMDKGSENIVEIVGLLKRKCNFEQF
jgi:hypothetical protein